MRESPLTDDEERLLGQARALVPGPPPPPWRAAAPVFAGGIVAGGWTSTDHIVLISHDGYSVTDPLTGERLVRNRDSVRTFAALASDHLSFTLPDSGESIAVFGLWGGDGSHVTADGWALEVIYPWWPNVDVLLRRPRSGPVGGYFEGSSLIEGLGTVTWLGCGFSPSGRCFMLLGSDGPKIYVR